MVLSVSERTFAQEVLESQIPVLVNFWAPWCRLCRNVQPLLLQLQTYCSEQIKLVEINADQNFKLSNAYRLTTIPTLLVIEEGIIRQRRDNFHGREELRLALEEIRVSYTARRITSTGEQGESVVLNSLSMP